jgi:hypothetical protein
LYVGSDYLGTPQFWGLAYELKGSGWIGYDHVRLLRTEFVIDELVGDRKFYQAYVLDVRMTYLLLLGGAA